MRFDRASTQRTLRSLVVLLFVVLLFSSIGAPGSQALPAGGPGSSGVDTSLPDTDSAVTVSGRGEFSDLRIRINQTRNLVNQAVSLSWTGGKPTSTSDRFAENYLQVMQCWGEDDGTNPQNPGPPPEQCVAGATTGAFGVQSQAHALGTLSVTRIIGATSWPGYDPTVGVTDPKSGLVFRSFRAVDGNEVGVQFDVDFNPALGSGNFWLNSYFDIITTNELAGSRTRPNGTGTDLFEINTGVESSGLGCGQRLPVPGGTGFRTPKCWLVIVPRGSATQENAGTPLDQNLSAVMTSPLSPASWKNRVAVPLEFNPVDSACELGAEDRRIIGTELVLPAVSSWQPALCATPGLPSYSFANVADATARQQILTPAPGAPGMVLVQKAADPATVDPRSPVVYAPVALSGAVIGFNVERVPKPAAGPDYQALNGIRVADLNLTPRLVAKLLTQSYRNQVEVGSVPPPNPPYGWSTSNPANLQFDPDFVQFNPEFAELLVSAGRNFSGFVLPGANSDAANQIWQWILADPEAKAWLDGNPDPWGMKVNPVYATTAAANPSGFPFAEPPPVNFPKADPHCFEVPPGAVVVPNPPALCGVDWLPFTSSFRDAARLTRAADDRARVVLNQTALTSSQVWARSGPQLLGQRAILSITDSASAAAFGLQTARLSRAGDNGPDRTFVKPDNGGLTAGLAGLKPGPEPTVLEADPRAAAPSGYPLTALTYAMIRPLALDADARSDYAAFIDYAVGAGQVSGLEPGQLPRGFATLPRELRDAATAAAVTIRELQPPPEPVPAPPPTPVPSGTVAPPPASSSSPAPAPPRTTAPTTVAPAATTETAASPVVEPEEESNPLLTPVLALARNRFVLPALAAIALLSALGALEITKRPRRGAPAPPGGSS
jgi:hypothetical protein